MNRKYTLLTFLLLYAVIGVIGLVCLFSKKTDTAEKNKAEADFISMIDSLPDTESVPDTSTAARTESISDTEISSNTKTDISPDNTADDTLEDSSDSDTNDDSKDSSDSNTNDDSKDSSDSNTNDDSEDSSDSNPTDDSDHSSDSNPDVTVKDFSDTPIGTFTVNQNGLRLHTTPSVNSKVLIYLQAGNEGDVFWQDDNWTGISYKNVKGFVSTEYLTIEKKNGD